MASLNVDDTQTAHSKSYARIAIVTLIIRSAVNHDRRHPVQQNFAALGILSQINNPVNSTHRFLLLTSI